MYHGLLNSCATLSKAFMKSMRTVSTVKTERKRVSMPLHTLLVIEWFTVCIFYIPLSHPFLMSKAFMKSMHTVSTVKTERKRVSIPLHTLLVIEWFMVCIFYIPLSHPFLIVSSRNWSFFRLFAFHGKALCCMYNFRYSLRKLLSIP